MKNITFKISNDVHRRWREATENMRWGKREALFRQMLEHMIRQLEQARRPRLAEIIIRKHQVK